MRGCNTRKEKFAFLPGEVVECRGVVDDVVDESVEFVKVKMVRVEDFLGASSAGVAAEEEVTEGARKGGEEDGVTVDALEVMVRAEKMRKDVFGGHEEFDESLGDEGNGGITDKTSFGEIGEF